MFLAPPNILPTVKRGNSHAYSPEILFFVRHFIGEENREPRRFGSRCEHLLQWDTFDTFSLRIRGRMHRCVLTAQVSNTRAITVARFVALSLRFESGIFVSPRIPVFQYAIRLLTSKSRATTGKQRRTTFYPKQ